LQPGFHRQPYVQLAQVLRNNGDDAGAQRVLAAADEIASSGSPPLARMIAPAYRLAPYVALLAIGAMLVWYRRRLRTAIGVYKPAANFEPLVDLPDPPRRRRATGSLEPEERSQKAHEVGYFNGVGEQAQSLFVRQGEYWTIQFAGATDRLRDAKGLRYIGWLLAHPGQRIHVIELVTAVDGAAPDARSSITAVDDGLEVVSSLDGTDYVIDSRARTEYASRLRELRAELEEADNFNDLGRSERLRSEIDLISDELTASSGKASRRAPAAAERARVMVGKNIRSTMEKIRREVPEWGVHFTRSLSTGYYCLYQPEADQVVTWRL